MELPLAAQGLAVLFALIDAALAKKTVDARLAQSACKPRAASALGALTPKVSRPSCSDGPRDAARCAMR
jgi:hypothetical protein